MTEIDDIIAFFGNTVPFDGLDVPVLAELARHTSVRYEKRGSKVLSVGDENQHLYLVRSGAVELHELGDSLTARLGEGSCFAYPSLMRDGKIRNAVTAIEDTLLYLVPASIFHKLRAEHQPVSQFFSGAEATRLRSALSARETDGKVSSTQRLGTLIRRAPVTAEPDLSVHEAAKYMSEHSVSSLLIQRDDKLVGIVTDRDLRSRVLATGLPLETNLSEVMTHDPLTVAASQSVLDALMLMSERSIHHLPVMDGDGALLGMISSNDVLAAEAAGAVPVARSIRKAQSVDELVKVLERLPDMVGNLVDSSVDGAPVASQIASVGLAVHRRVIELAEASLGPAPVPYCFLVFGSLARRDQTLMTDQDNGLLLSDDYDEAKHGDYFRALAKTVSDDLNRCGYSYCNGNVMATNPQWCQSLNGWKSVFEDWITAPEPKALMHASIFFDSAAVWGDTSLRDDLMAYVLPLAKKNRLFLAHMVENALTAKVPIGFFRWFVLTQDKNHEDRLDIKKSGLMALIDIVRVYSLAHGVGQSGYIERVEALKEAGALAETDLQEMLDAWNFMMTIRLSHQVQQVKRQDDPDNMIAPGHLSAFEREHLRDAFSLIKTHQGGLSRSLAGGHY